jgi:hypothetical protein
MEIRLMGLEEECKAAIEPLQRIFVVVEVNGPYANRGDSKQVRYFIQTRGLRLCPGGSPSSNSSI